MGTYLKLYLRSVVSGKERLCKGVVNTGFRSEGPDISIPLGLAEELGLWPPPPGSYQIEASTASGRTLLNVVPRSLEVKVVAEGKESRAVLANAVINPHDDEVLVSDALTEELGVQIMFPRRGLWKFIDDPPDKLRTSVET